MSDLTWSDLAKAMSDATTGTQKFCAVIRPGIYKYIKLMKYHHWKNKYLLWEHNWRMK